MVKDCLPEMGNPFGPRVKAFCKLSVSAMYSSLVMVDRSESTNETVGSSALARPFDCVVGWVT